MTRILFSVLGVYILLLSVSCGPTPPTVLITTSQTETKVNLDAAITIGNHTWLPLNLEQGKPFGEPARPINHVLDILNILKAFEDAHPELETTGWFIEKEQRASGTMRNIFGIWVDHRPKQACICDCNCGPTPKLEKE
ncbi:MAG: hypothetical protein CEN90_244 [Parcubacteria group bacterium Licking1014_17]|nr:MAG: hypothetical protein CEN90_244 [Parcubacteria group bacterium Licking1014_17]